MAKMKDERLVNLVAGDDYGDGYDFVRQEGNAITLKDRESGLILTFIPLPILEEKPLWTK